MSVADGKEGKEGPLGSRAVEVLIECIAEITSHKSKSLNSLLIKGSPTPIYLGKFLHNGVTILGWR
ncbi:hypothetical protein F2Q69_00015503 [Brassica cretica]|uniref:Uncharacterized protein n=2 Tax=Brassica cretica TaxID=69181 RepID=A0ABQ7DHZ5_BRACR|nr:hypothetical protein F2Q69_00015503 [Brassica cretica]KAF3577577.1 hypothetical protein DY000_02032844 [Brassica cretica]